MHPIEYVQPHPGFNKTTTDFDIGLIKVRIFCYVIQPIYSTLNAITPSIFWTG